MEERERERQGMEIIDEEVEKGRGSKRMGKQVKTSR